jgi:hypothetical protein
VRNSSFLQSPITSSLFSPNILLSTLFSSTVSLCSSFNVWDQVLHPYRTDSLKGQIVPVLNYKYQVITVLGGVKVWLHTCITILDGGESVESIASVKWHM